MTEFIANPLHISALGLEKITSPLNNNEGFEFAESDNPLFQKTDSMKENLLDIEEFETDHADEEGRYENPLFNSGPLRLSIIDEEDDDRKSGEGRPNGVESGTNNTAVPIVIGEERILERRLPSLSKILKLRIDEEEKADVDENHLHDLSIEEKSKLPRLSSIGKILKLRATSKEKEEQHEEEEEDQKKLVKKRSSILNLFTKPH